MRLAAAVVMGAVEGLDLSVEERDLLGGVPLAGLTLFRRNVPPDHQDLAHLVAAVQALRPVGEDPRLIAIDQEGGRVARLRAPFPDSGPALTLEDGAVDDDALARIADQAARVGQALSRLGINVNFAPVVDVLTEPTNTSIGDRAFGTDVEPVCRRAGAFLHGLQRSGVYGCLKHFPGQGDAKVDTHVGRAMVDLPVKVLNDREFVPFRALLKEASMIMASHCIYPALDTLEASRSPKILGAILRGQMGYGGVIVSDDMLMGALPQEDAAWQDAIVDTVAAGADLVLVCRHVTRAAKAIEALQKAAAKSRAFRTRLEEAVGRLAKLRRRLIGDHLSEPEP